MPKGCPELSLISAKELVLGGMGAKKTLLTMPGPRVQGPLAEVLE